MKYFIFFLLLSLYKSEIGDYVISSKRLFNPPDTKKLSKKREKQTEQAEKIKVKEALKSAVEINIIPDDEEIFEAFRNMDEENEDMLYLKNKIGHSLKFKNKIKLII